MATTLVVEVPPGATIHNQLISVKTRDDAIPYRGVPVPTLSEYVNNEEYTPLGIAVASKHLFGSLWELTVVVEGVVTFYSPEHAEIGHHYTNGLKNLGGNRVYISPERIAPMPFLS